MRRSIENKPLSRPVLFQPPASFGPLLKTGNQSELIVQGPCGNGLDWRAPWPAPLHAHTYTHTTSLKAVFLTPTPIQWCIWAAFVSIDNTNQMATRRKEERKKYCWIFSKKNNPRIVSSYIYLSCVGFQEAVWLRGPYLGLFFIPWRINEEEAWDGKIVWMHVKEIIDRFDSLKLHT